MSELALRLRASDVAERAAAAAALGRRGPASAAAVPALLEALRDGRAPATAFSWALGQVGAPAVPALADALRDEDEELRSRAIDALVVIGAAAREELLRALRAPGAEARAAAALALARMAPAPEVTRELLLAARDPDEAVRHHAALGLARVGAEDWPAVEAASRSLAREERQVALAASAQRSGWGDAPAADLASAREGGDEAEAAAPHRRR
ncbi:MAG: HEAT repeat domain-containing protein [Planctomycetota bacterium]